MPGGARTSAYLVFTGFRQWRPHGSLAFRDRHVFSFLFYFFLTRLAYLVLLGYKIRAGSDVNEAALGFARPTSG